MIDTHCHLDLYPNPIQIIEEAERQNITVIGMTNLPSHFSLGYNHVKKFRKVRLSLGMHPLLADRHVEEYALFDDLLHKTSYIGEVGLDFSKEGIGTKDIQIETFKYILSSIKGQNKILSIHSRKAEKEVLSLLCQYEIKNAIFHWYSGPLNILDKIIEAGYYLSVNPAMIRSVNGRKIISRIPENLLLTESDGPFIKVNSKIVHPNDISNVLKYLSENKGKSVTSIDTLIDMNFRKLVSSLT